MSVAAAAESAFITSVELSSKSLFWAMHTTGTNLSSSRCTFRLKKFNDK